MWSHSFLYSHLQTLSMHAMQHLVLAFLSTTIAIIIGVPTGILLQQKAKFRGIILGTANIFQGILFGEIHNLTKGACLDEFFVQGFNHSSAWLMDDKLFVFSLIPEGARAAIV